MKELFLISTLIVLLSTSCKAQSIPYSTSREEFEQVKRMIPKGFVLFTESGARLALKANADALAYKMQATLSDSTVIIQQKDIAFLKAENKRLKLNNTLKEIEIWGYRVLIVTKIFKLW